MFNNGTFTQPNSTLCVGQDGTTLLLVPSGGVECTVSIHNDYTCTDYAYDADEICNSFGGTGHSFLIHGCHYEL